VMRSNPIQPVMKSCAFRIQGFPLANNVLPLIRSARDAPETKLCRCDDVADLAEVMLEAEDAKPRLVPPRRLRDESSWLDL